MTLSEKTWVGIGLAGQFFFTMRFVVQWIATERKRRSVIPESFWYFSIFGSLILLVYSLYRKDPVFILGQAFGTTVYVRNLFFIHKEKKDAAASEME
ncbi:lipid-A-disaccharide synthase N-terminal domain-containing protein [Geomonas edaphica]|uniref:lipid-A-disaccharide synthase N-terminal domain-containing protein n=1 Tax=Geomonas edaphica TaxID=2570226 RepID=UPI0010A92104|nr:lipid-A-disaccharide synthase N-terminal domain-containing protein [Geomonas edaphica]